MLAALGPGPQRSLSEQTGVANGDRRDMSKGAKAMLAALGAALVLSTTTGVSHSFISRARQPGRCHTPARRCAPAGGTMKAPPPPAATDDEG